MSHVKTGTVIITDIDCLQLAVESIDGLTFKRDQKTHRWFGVWADDYSKADAAYKNGVDTKDYGKCEHAIECRGSQYDIGVVRRKDGKGYTLVWDFYGSGMSINRKIGDQGQLLAKEYNRQVVLKRAKTEGWHVTQQTRNGVDQLVLTKV